MFIFQFSSYIYKVINNALVSNIILKIFNINVWLKQEHIRLNGEVKYTKGRLHVQICVKVMCFLQLLYH